MTSSLLPRLVISEWLSVGLVQLVQFHLFLFSLGFALESLCYSGNINVTSSIDELLFATKRDSNTKSTLQRSNTPYEGPNLANQKNLTESWREIIPLSCYLDSMLGQTKCFMSK